MSLQFPRTLNAMKHETSCIEERIDLTPEQFANNEEYFKKQGENRYIYEGSAKKNSCRSIFESSYFDTSVIERESRVVAVTDWRI